MRNTIAEIKDGGYYAAAQDLKHTVVAPPESALNFTITIGGDTFTKRGIKGVDGNITLMLNDLTELVKTNTFEFKPFSDFAMDEFADMDISYTSDSVLVELSIKITNAIISPATYTNAGDFLTQQTTITLDERFETGANFFGVIDIEYTTEDGQTGTGTVGVDGELSYLSFRTVSILPDGVYEAKAVGFPAYSIATSAVIAGFESNSLTECTIESGGTAMVNIVDDSYLSISAGTVYNIKIICNTAMLKHEFALSEGNSNVTEVHDSITGLRFYLIGGKTQTTHNDQTSPIHKYGFQIIDLLNYTTPQRVIVARKNDRDLIYNEEII